MRKSSVFHESGTTVPKTERDSRTHSTSVTVFSGHVYVSHFGLQRRNPKFAAKTVVNQIIAITKQHQQKQQQHRARARTLPTFSKPPPALLATRWATASSTCRSPSPCSLTANVLVYSWAQSAICADDRATATAKAVANTANPNLAVPSRLLPSAVTPPPSSADSVDMVFAMRYGCFFRAGKQEKQKHKQIKIKIIRIRRDQQTVGNRVENCDFSRF